MTNLCISCTHCTICKFADKLKDLEKELEKVGIPIYSSEDVTISLNPEDNVMPFYARAGCIHYKPVSLTSSPYYAGDMLLKDINVYCTPTTTPIPTYKNDSYDNKKDDTIVNSENTNLNEREKSYEHDLFIIKDIEYDTGSEHVLKINGKSIDVLEKELDPLNNKGINWRNINNKKLDKYIGKPLTLKILQQASYSDHRSIKGSVYRVTKEIMWFTPGDLVVALTHNSENPDVISRGKLQFWYCEKTIDEIAKEASNNLDFRSNEKICSVPMHCLSQLLYQN